MGIDPEGAVVSSLHLKVGSWGEIVSKVGRNYGFDGGLVCGCGFLCLRGGRTENNVKMCVMYDDLDWTDRW